MWLAKIKKVKKKEKEMEIHYLGDEIGVNEKRSEPDYFFL